VDPSENLPPELERFWRTNDGLTACERAAAYGIDLSLLDENLRLTPSERLRRNDSRIEHLNALARAYVSVLENLAVQPLDALFLTLDALILARRASNRPRDLHAVLELEAIRERLHSAREGETPGEP
jgi:hypothetical protein